jgi:hypothetical protein
MKKFFSIGSVFLSISILLVSCSNGPDERTPGEYLSAYIKANPDVVTFGKIDIHSILEKAEYRSVPKFGVVAHGYLQSLAGSVNLETPVHFALEGPFLEDGTPKTIIAFVETINKDSLASKLMEQGYDLDEYEGMSYFSSGNVAIGIKNNLSLIVSKKEKYDARKVLAEAFADVRKELSGDKIEEILEEKGEIVSGVSIENLYVTSNTELANLPANKKKELKEMAHDSYIKSTVNFDEGEMRMETKNLFSEKLMSNMFFRADSDAKVAKQLGKGEPIMGFSMNMDVRKFQDFMDSYSPETMPTVVQSAGPLAMFYVMSGGKLSNLLSGEMGIALLGQPDMMEGLSDFNFFVGLGKQGKIMAEQQLIPMLKESMEHVELTGTELTVASKKSNAPSTASELTLPDGAESFGTKGMHLFLNLEKVDLSTFEFEGPSKLINQLKFVSFEMDNEGSIMIVKAKKPNVNILKQAVDVLVKEMKGKISGFDS